jgi:hypothetical protein
MSRHNHVRDPIPWRRLTLIIVLSGLAGVLLLWIPTLAQPQQTGPRWETVIDEDFGGAFPGTSWTLIDASETDGGEYLWGRRTFTQTGEVTYTTPITALWSVGGGEDGLDLIAGTSTYVDNLDTWAIYGPIDMYRAFEAELQFDWWLDTATSTATQADVVHTLEAQAAPESGDWLGWCVLTDIEDLQDCQGTYVSGASSRWYSGTLSFKPYTMFPSQPTGNPSLWIAFHFVSDDDGQVGLGAFVDNVVLRVNRGFEAYLPMTRKDPTPTPTLTPTPTPSPTPSLDYFDDFSSASSGWTTHSASSGLTTCDNAREHLDYKYNLYYQGGRYKVNIPLDCRAAGDHGDTRHVYPVTFAPGVSRTLARTCVQMGGIFETWDPYWSFYGLVFAASEDKSIVYSLEVNNLGDWAIIKRTDYKYPGPNHPWQNETREAVQPDTGYSGGQRWPAKTAFNQNVLRVDIGSNEVNFYINGTKMYTLRDPARVNQIRSLRKVGLIGGDWEITPTQIGYDYFFMDNGCDTY